MIEDLQKILRLWWILPIFCVFRHPSYRVKNWITVSEPECQWEDPWLNTAATEKIKYLYLLLANDYRSTSERLGENDRMISELWRGTGIWSFLDKGGQLQMYVPLCWKMWKSLSFCQFDDETTIFIFTSLWFKDKIVGKSSNPNFADKIILVQCTVFFEV